MLLLPHTWNSGMLVFKGIFSLIDIFNLYVGMVFAITTISQFPITHYSILPVFHHSNWGVAPKFYLWITRKTIDGLRQHIDQAINWLLHGKGWDQTDSFCDRERPHIPFRQRYPPTSGDVQTQKEEK